MVVLKGHEVETEIIHGNASQLWFSDTFIEGGQGEGGDVVSDFLFPDLVEIVFLLAKVGEVEVLGKANRSGQDKEEADEEAEGGAAEKTDDDRTHGIYL
jgi:hypothetical protein